MKWNVLLLLTVVSLLSAAQQKGEAAKSSAPIDSYQGIVGVMEERHRIWLQLNRAFDASYLHDLIHPPKNIDKLCQSSCTDELQRVTQARHEFIKAEQAYYQKHLNEMVSSDEAIDRTAVRDRERISQFDQSSAIQKSELDALKEQMKALDKASEGNSEKMRAARETLQRAIERQQDIVDFSEGSKDNLEKTVAVLEQRQAATHDLEKLTKLDITNVKADDEYWQSNYDLRAAQFALICLPSTPRPPILDKPSDDDQK